MSEFKYTVGDRVRIKSIDWYYENRDRIDEVICGNTNFIPDMVKYCGEIVTISSVLPILEVYHIKEDGGMFNWTDEMIEELVEEETKPKFKVGDRVIVRDASGIWEITNVEDNILYTIKRENHTATLTTYGGFLTLYEGISDKMIECEVEEETKPKFKVGDKIKLKSTLLNDIFGVIGYEPEGYRITNISNGLTYFMSYSIEHCYELVEEEGKETSWKPSKEEMDVLYSLAYITNKYDEHKEEVITRLYQDLKREFFNDSSYENMFPNTENDVRRRSTIQVLEYARSLDNYNQYGKTDIDKNIAWLEKQGKSALEARTDNELVEEEVGLVDNLSSRWVNEFNLPEGYIFKDENGNEIRTSKIILEKANTLKTQSDNMETETHRGYCTTEPETTNKSKKVAWFTFWDNDFADKVELDLSNRELIQEDGKWFVVKKKKEYPKTYEECREIVKVGKEHTLEGEIIRINNYKIALLETFQKLLICRDAYWTLYGEEKGLGKPWEPDYDSGVNKYGIICMNGVVQESNPTTNWERHLNKVLDFPTAEMRDTFKKNFDPDIEFCKEFL